ncbi:hypothetical protein KC19_8G062400 [Ceratodon purpureus]|uniref:Dirigent protein n=1 Tax=Ceratodon purpureus TaxID=3225 RepID=A0A8T0H0A6_CERPU|nr:hypothetical protein KC19_8G062400 [Ceratodon purpureus]
MLGLRTIHWSAVSTSSSDYATTIMASSSVVMAYTLYALFCICTLQKMALAQDQPASLHLTYYVHEIRYGPNATLLAAAGTGQGNFSAAGWGTFSVFENALKEGPTADSKLVANITGTGVITTIGGLPSGGIQISAEHIFNEASGYNDSSLTITGTLSSPRGPPWECIVPGGTGYFRGYRGYVLAEPYAATTVPPLFVDKWDIYISK